MGTIVVDPDSFVGGGGGGEGVRVEGGSWVPCVPPLGRLLQLYVLINQVN